MAAQNVTHAFNLAACKATQKALKCPLLLSPFCPFLRITPLLSYPKKAKKQPSPRSKAFMSAALPWLLLEGGLLPTTFCAIELLAGCPLILGSFLKGTMAMWSDPSTSMLAAYTENLHQKSKVCS